MPADWFNSIAGGPCICIEGVVVTEKIKERLLKDLDINFLL